ncbi:MAG: hypothetical protein BWK80_23370 [Desulfobacteraceae bacterium IS3]|nr:MAG: hypothetical protein BWK80_23370 [Desulfobacteraceae bacterium IS3]
MNKKKYIYYLLIISVLGIWCLRLSFAGTAEEQYYKTETLYRKFLQDVQKTKYRENWLYYIEEFRKAYNLDTSGSLAATALYMSGELYWELYKRSVKNSDKKEAIDAFERVAKNFPQSIYKRKADEVLQILSGAKKDSASPGASAGKDEDKKETPKTAPAPVNTEAEKVSLKSSSQVKHIVRRELFRNSKSAYKASLSAKTDTGYKQPAPPETPKNIPPPAVTLARAGANTNITGLRYWSNPSYTRIVVDADRDTGYIYNLIKKDAANKSHRLCIDFKNSRLGKNVQSFIPINDDLLTTARAGDYESGMVRVVIDIKSFKTYKIFSLKNPFRTIVDVWGDVPAQATASTANRTNQISSALSPIQMPPPPTSKPEPPPAKIPPGHGVELHKQLALGIRRIVIDPGHGGHDGGAPGYYKHVHEKDVVLAIGKLLAEKVRRELGCEAILTRSTDRFLSLEERTAIANTKNADLFISIHTNAHTDHSAYGIETYFLNLATDEDSIRVAARENATTRKNISDLQKILSDLMRNSKINESSRLAAYVQRTMYSQINSVYGRVKNKGVKQAPFYVLLGAQMPSILIETSFISNKRECERLTDPGYQGQLCDAIIKGIRRYIEDTSPTALLRMRGSG